MNKLTSYQWMINFIKCMALSGALLTAIIIPSSMGSGLLAEIIASTLAASSIVFFCCGVCCAVKGVSTK